MPYRFDTPLTPEQIIEVEKYNVNDLEITVRVARVLEGALAARFALKQAHGVDVLNKRDSQMAETVMRQMMFGNNWPTRPGCDTWVVNVRDLLHPRITLADPTLAETFETVADWRLVATVESDGREKSLEIEKPAGLEVNFHGVTYALGTGGLHSRDTPAIFEETEDVELIDIDVASYYPALMALLRLCPKHLGGNAFLDAYIGLTSERIAAKRAGDKPLATGLKVAINSIFGKCSSAYSWLLDPTVGWAICINGQFILLMLIEQLMTIKGVTVPVGKYRRRDGHGAAQFAGASCRGQRYRGAVRPHF